MAKDKLKSLKDKLDYIIEYKGVVDHHLIYHTAKEVVDMLDKIYKINGLYPQHCSGAHMYDQLDEIIGDYK